MQEISYSDVNWGKEFEDMKTALGWMNVEWYTFSFTTCTTFQTWGLILLICYLTRILWGLKTGSAWYKSSSVCTYARLWVCKYWHVQLPETFKGTDSSGETLCSQRETPDFKSASYQYSLMSKMKWLSSFLWKCQLGNKVMWIGLGRLRTRNSPASLTSTVSAAHILLS
jgi:hypothetical protein